MFWVLLSTNIDLVILFAFSHLTDLAIVHSIARCSAYADLQLSFAHELVLRWCEQQVGIPSLVQYTRKTKTETIDSLWAAIF